MMVRAAAALALGSTAAAGCSEPGPAERVGPAEPAERAAPEAPPAPAAPPLFDAQGHLLPSEQRIAGLTLPRGIALESEAEGRYRYRNHDARVSYAKLVAYFGPRLFTGEVERVGKGIIYRSAVPQDQLDATVKLDVWITPGKRGTTVVELRERRPAPAQPRSVSELRKELERQRTQLE